MRKTFVLILAAVPSAIWAQNGTPPTQPKQQITGQAQSSGASSPQAQKSVQAVPATLGPEDAEIQRLKDKRQRLLKQKEIEKLRKENEQLEAGGEKPANAQTPPAKELSPEDVELQRLEQERQRLLKELEIEKLRKQNEALKAAAAQPSTLPATQAIPSVPPAAPLPQPAVSPCTAAKSSAKAQGSVHVGPGDIFRKPLGKLCKDGGICVGQNTGADVAGGTQTKPCPAPTSGPAGSK